MSCNCTKSVSMFVSKSGGRAPHPDHVLVLAHNGIHMALVRHMELQHAGTDGIKRLGSTGMQQLAPAMQVCCPASFLLLLYMFSICFLVLLVAVPGLEVGWVIFDQATKGTAYNLECPHTTCLFKTIAAWIAHCIQVA